MSPEHVAELALRIVRDGLQAERIAIGETTEAAETYRAKHAKEDPHIVPMLWRARSENA